MSLTIISVSNPIYSKVNNSTIDCLLTTVEHGQIPFTAAAYDPMSYGKKLWKELQAGTYGMIADYIAPSASPEKLPDLITQIAKALIANGTLKQSDIHPDTFAELSIKS